MQGLWRGVSSTWNADCDDFVVHVHVNVIRQISTVMNDRHSVPTQESWMIVFEEAAEMPWKRTKKTQQSEDVSYMIIADTA